jgi:xanthine dehydrogenase accessory factor
MAAGDSGGRRVTSTDVIVEAGKLAAEGKPYALATVVSVVRPASARRGDRALVAPDGTVTGWIGGACSEPTVVRESLRALADRQPRLARMEGGCASEGVVEVLIEPVLPAPLLATVGESPAARTLGALARTVGWRVRDDGVEGADAVVVATMGRGDEDLLAAALDSGAGYVGLVASARRAATVLDTLRERGLDEEAVLRIRAPAGLDLGPSSQEEIAVAILAELVAWRHTRGEVPEPVSAPAEAVDPVCGMTVAVTPDAVQVEHEGETVYFCSAHCKARFEAEPDRYSGLRAS